MIASVGELVEDIVVRVDALVNMASDTAAEISRRRGGSAANVCAAAAWSGRAARFIGQVGEDRIGGALTEELGALGVDLAVRRRGRSGTVVVFVDHAGERTMFPDPAASHQLDSPERSWLDRVDLLHVPVYSLVAEPLATTAATLIAWAHEAGLRVSIDASSVGVLERAGVATMIARLTQLRPHILLANAAEASCLGDGLAAIGAPVTVVKHGARPAEVHVAGRTTAVPALDIGDVDDTTAAGDSFAAGFLTAAIDGADPVDCARAGHRLAASVLTSPTRP